MKILPIILLLAGFGYQTASAQSATDRDERRAAIDTIVKAYGDVYGFAGTVLVVDDEQPLIQTSIGLADRAFGIANTATTRNSINSISKTFTALAVVRMAERGRIELDAAIGRYLPALKAEWRNRVTVHHLLSHSSGLPREAGLDSHDRQTLEQQLDDVAQLTLLFEPGQRFGYSNAGYILLGNLLEAVSGTTYAEIIEQEILKPLKLENTGVYEGRVVVANQAEPYRMTPRGVERAQRTKTLGETAGGGLYSTATDLYRYTRALENNALLSDDMQKMLFARHVTGEGSDYEGYAWSIKQFGDQTLRFAAGSGYGTKSVIIRDPQQGQFIGIVSNWGNTPILQLLRDIYLSVKGQDIQPPSSTMLAKPSNHRAQLGSYAFDAETLRTALQIIDGELRLHVHEGKLFLDDELLVAGPDGTLALTYTDELVIRLDGDCMTLEIGGQSLKGTRIRQPGGQ